ncbi:MAG: sensor histidine kinase, partial [Planctomycetota bacterium]
MRKYIHNLYHRFLVFSHLSPLSLAEKCRLQFGAAVVFSIAIALILPYVWMGQLTKKAVLDSSRTMAETLFERHFRNIEPGETSLAQLGSTGSVSDVNNFELQWVFFKKETDIGRLKLTEEEAEVLESLKGENERDDHISLSKKSGNYRSTYIRVFRANDNCISCHNPQGSAAAFNRNEPIGAAIVQKSVGEMSKIVLLNRVLIAVAVLIAGAGAIVTFYMITQRVILRPIRQLRGLVNNVAEGNLDIRSSIKTGDEYEKLADAFNNMLNGLQLAQQKLRDANKQLDDKIVELSDRNIELFKANKIKSEFLANVSHEFRTPLNAILGFAEILHEKPDSLDREKTKRYTENIITGGKRLLNMINDLLELAKTEAGKIKLHIEKISLYELCDMVLASFSSLTRRKRIKTKLTIAEGIPELVTDAGKVQQILYNFLSNAVKFTPEEGRIEISASMLDEKTVRVAVSDSGCGISESDREKIFEKFRQADGSITRQTTGSGLGLAICRELAALLAGTIAMESQVGKGSKFWLDIPVALTKD